VVPTHRNLSINPSFDRPVKFMEASPRDHFLFIIDEQSTLTLVNLKLKIFLTYPAKGEKEQITCIRWLNNGQSLAAGTASGKVVIWGISG
jgi:WD40 repeat protein